MHKQTNGCQKQCLSSNRIGNGSRKKHILSTRYWTNFYHMDFSILCQMYLKWFNGSVQQFLQHLKVTGWECCNFTFNELWCITTCSACNLQCSRWRYHIHLLLTFLIDCRLYQRVENNALYVPVKYAGHVYQQNYTVRQNDWILPPGDLIIQYFHCSASKSHLPTSATTADCQQLLFTFS